MASPPDSPRTTPQGFNHRRTYPDLPPGYDWDTQIKKYCPRYLTTTLMVDKSKRPHKYGYQGLMLHEVDARLARPPADRPTAFDGFLAHDEVANRITSKSGRWSSMNVSVIKSTKIVIRRVDPKKGDLASTYRETDQKVPLLDMILWARSGVKNLNIFAVEDYDGDGSCLQLDLRGNDFIRALIFYNKRQVITVRKIILKGYSFDFASAEALDTAAFP
ncbi:hypothetical protein H2200_011330 [Cladophialophora chaetospira]|uniref:Uncharacterized protein n=1 Tax=Cladophialophora chaetospira TaxID=386627 RepID=A0AA38X0F2_9EURO|nr:hypothetical protein H2200_011330 [Cladophialophora chaetospira]